MKAPSSSPQTSGSCPRCGAPGKAVKLVTLQSLLKPNVLARASSEIYRFCPNEPCEVVYFTERGGPTFGKADLKVRVGIKETNAPRPLCYCFGHTAEEIDEEIRLTGKTTVLDDIKTRMKEACWCETKNPQGSCCLAAVTRYAKSSLERDSSPVAALASAEVDCCVAASDQNTASGLSHSNRSGTARARRAERFAMIGSMVSGVFASACCWLPLLLLVAGISGAAVGAAFERYRPILLVVTFGFLGAAFYMTYRPRIRIAGRLVAARKSGSCASECCGPTSGRKWTPQNMNRVMLWIVAAITLAFALFPNYAALLFKGGHRGSTLAKRGDSNAVFIAIEGMTCKACATVLQSELASSPGVASAEVSYEKKLAVLHLGKRSLPRIEEVLVRIKNAGYGGAVVNVPQSLAETPEAKSEINQENQDENKRNDRNR